MLRGLSIAICLLASLYLALAGHAVYRVLGGLSSGDAPTVAAYLDAPSVKQKLKQQVDAFLVNRSRNGLGRRNDLGAQIGAGLIAALGPALANNIVDALVTPEGLARILTSVEKRPDNRGQGETSGGPGLFTLLRQLRPLGLDRFELVDKSDGALVFSFRDWGWRITEIRAPPKMIEGLMR
jgi:hypothetical protein